MELDFSILRCNPIVAPIREKRLEENKRATVFPSFFRLQFWAKGAGHNSVNVCCKVLYPASLLQAFRECLPVSERHCKEPIGMLRRNGTASLGSLSVAAQIPKERQSRSHRDSLKDSGSFVLSTRFNGPGMEAWVPIPAFTLTWFVALAMSPFSSFSHLHNTRSDHWLL